MSENSLPAGVMDDFTANFAQHATKQSAEASATHPEHLETEAGHTLELYLMTIPQLAEFIASKLNYAQIWTSDFPNCDFAIVEVQPHKQYSQEALECIHSGAAGWYGIRAVNFGFDSSTLFAVADIYGGGCDQVCRLYDGIGVIEAEILLQEAIRKALDGCETVLEDTILIVEFRDKEAKKNA